MIDTSLVLPKVRMIAKEKRLDVTHHMLLCLEKKKLRIIDVCQLFLQASETKKAALILYCENSQKVQSYFRFGRNGLKRQRV